MLSNECLFGYHDTCVAPQWCDCLCHDIGVAWVSDDWEDE